MEAVRNAEPARTTRDVARPADVRPPAESHGELWLFTLDHKRLAAMHAILIGLALVAGLFLAAGLAMQPIAGRGSGASAETLRRIYSMHGLALTFLVALPAIPTVLGNWLLPERCGVREMAWPRVNLFSFHLLAASLALFVIAFLAAPSDAGWSFDAPFSVTTNAPIAWSAFAAICAVLSFACSGANLLATIAFSRREASAKPLPLFAWALGGSALVQMLAAPVLVALLSILLAQRGGTSDVLAPTTVGSDVAFATWFSVWSYAASGAVALAIVAIVSEVVDAHAGEENAPAARAPSAAVIGACVLAFAGAGAQGIGSRTGTSVGISVAGSALALLALTPIAVWCATWVGALARRNQAASSSLGFAIAAIVLLAASALSSLFLASLGSGAYLASTTFAPAQMHFLALGAVCAFLAGIHHLWARWTGGVLRESWGWMSCLLVLGGVLLVCVPQLVLGYLGQPHRSETLVTGEARWSVLAALGAAATVSGLLLAGWNLLASAMDARSTEASSCQRGAA